MAEQAHSPRPSASPWRQSALGVALALAVCLPYGSVALLSRSARVTAWLLRQQAAECQSTNRRCRYDVGFIDPANRLLLDELPRADYARGGVYFVGSSTVRDLLLPWRLPPDQRRLIGDYALSAATHRQQFQFVRYLVEHEGLLEAGGGKTLVVLGLHCGNANRERGHFNWYFPKLFERYGLYAYRASEGIRPAPMSRLARLLRIERARCQNFLEFARSRPRLWRRGQPPPPAAQPPDKALYRDQADGLFEPGWRQTMAEQMTELGRLVDYLHARQARVAAVLVPIGSWLRALPQAEAFHQQAEALCKAKAAPLLDLSGMLADEEFMDYAHPTWLGQQRTHPVLVALALEHLRSTGALPQPPAADHR